MKIFKQKLNDTGACSEAIEWVGDRTLEQAWNECERGDWMLWFAKESGVTLKSLTLAKARCAKLVIHLMKDERSRKAVEVAEKFGLGQATREELDKARDTAAYAAYAAAYAAYAAACAAYDAADAAYDADAADAAYDAAYDAYAADAAARKEVLRKCADICRDVLTFEISNLTVNLEEKK